MRRPQPAVWLVVVIAFTTLLPCSAVGPVSVEPDDPELKILEMFHVAKDNCQINRWSYFHDSYYVISETEIPTQLNITESLGVCDEKEQKILFDLNRFYVVALNPNLNNRGKAPFRISTYIINFDGRVTQELAPSIPTLPTSLDSIEANPDNCFMDMGNLMCCVSYGSTISREYKFLRFLQQNSAFAYIGAIPTVVTGYQSKIVFDSMRRELYEIVVQGTGTMLYRRKMEDMHNKGFTSVTFFEPEKMVSVFSFMGKAYHLVLDAPGHKKYSIFQANPVGSSIKVDPVTTQDWDDLSEGNQMAMLLNKKYNDGDNGAAIITQIALKRCETMQKKVSDCEADLSRANSTSTALYVVVGILMFFFIVLAVLLALYLLCCIKTKRRRRRKKKRKHRRHRKVASNKPEDGAAKPKGGSEEDVEMDPNADKKDGEKKEEEKEEEKKEENKVVKKIKAFGGVDYSSSSSDDDKEASKLEHSQAYFSARDQFDGQGNAVSPAATPGTNPAVPPPPGGDNNYENLGPLPGAPDGDTNTDGHGGVPEQDMAQAPGGAPRSVYMKPAKKKKK